MNEEKLYNAKEIAEQLGITKKEKNKLYVRWERLNKYLNRNDIDKDTLLTKEEVLKLCQTTKNFIPEELANKIGIDIKNVLIPTKEQETLNVIKHAFASLNCIKEYAVFNYRIDLYFPNERIAIECDELNHANRNEFYEYKRQKEIENVLHCKFIRYNPDCNNFNIGDVINEIMNLVYDPQSSTHAA
ncbi:hypothetical protein [Rummeliibacillus pycnus]|uniref:hypothetical protein n=1 Tax=Rummeliibacillus pycnus TaxID=101070 RepID=UPI000C9A25D4|nr:hypothetical protein [Rummeliibacillus pycnus]